ncbi:TonB-dependent receptor [Chitinophaga sp. Cy-1792]|uniref:TonB-dependent receptor n=1 Tax=Chitinophaga sp. Cy-1792 TaxID=2608339 RepID=UPI0014223F35|nr:TonB-dependent receptor [Chitinophaga sp. Cy-1792]NIG54549.1 TonB-dependent receptor [Chitinophaga sp. Cy-1792]
MSNQFVKRFAASLLIIAALLSAITGYAQHSTGTIHGIVYTTDKAAVPFVTVAVSGTNKGAVSNEQGIYDIPGLQPGTYLLVVKSVGLLQQTRSVTVKAGQQHSEDFILEKDVKSLQEVRVSIGYNKFARKEVEDVARLPIKNLENPQVYNVIPKELLQDQVIVSYNDVLKNVTGVSQALVNGSNSFNLRGFFTTSYLRNGLQDYKMNSIEVANIERIEVLKGPSATLFGSSLISFGGLLNRVSKQPLETFKGEVSYMTGGFGLNRATIDINTPISKEKGLYLRTNAAYHSEGSFQDAGFTRRFFLAPSLLYKPNQRLSILVDAEIYSQKGNDFNRLFPENSFTKTTPRDLNIDWKKSYSDNSLYERKPSATVYGNADYKISDSWKSHTSISYTHATEKGYYSWNRIIGDSVSRNPSYENNVVNNVQVQQNFNGDFKLAGMRHRIVLGLDYYRSNVRNDAASVYGFDMIGNRGNDPHYHDLTQTTLDKALAGIPLNSALTTQHTYSAYVSDVVNITQHLLAMLSVRADHFSNDGTKDLAKDTTQGKYSQTVASPKLGLVYQIVPEKVSLFANYMNGFSNNAPYRQPDGTVSSFKASQANQWETGIKLDILSGKLNSTISYYHIKVSDMVRNDFSPGRSNYQVQDGGQLSKGLEIEVIGNPFKGLNFIAGYAYNTIYTINTNKDVDGLRQWTGPGQTANLWINYYFLKGALKGLGLGIGGNYNDKSYIGQSRSGGMFYIPAYTVFNTAISYEHSCYKVAVKVDNLSNEVYWGSYVSQIMPRRLSASIAVKFGK